MKSKNLRSIAQTTFLFLLFAISFLLVIITPAAVTQVRGAETMQLHQISGLNLIQEARNLSNEGRFQEVVPLLQQAAAMFERQGDRLNQAMALSNLAATLAQLQRWDEAEQVINTSLSVLKSQPKSAEQVRILAQTQDIQAQLQMERGQVQAALDTWTQASKLYQQINANEQFIQTQINQSRAWEVLGLYPRACKTLLTALKLQSETCRFSKEALASWQNRSASRQNIQAMNALGQVLRVLGQLEQSERALMAGLAAAQKLNLTQEQAAIYLNLGNTKRAFANESISETQEKIQFERSALDYYTKAAQMSTRKETRMQAQVNQFSLLLDGEKRSEAEALWRSIQSEISEIPSNRAGLYTQINLAQNLLKLAMREREEGESKVKSQKSKVKSQNFSSSLFPLRTPRSALSANLQSPLWREIEEMLDRVLGEAKRLGDRRILAYILGIQGRLWEVQQQQVEAENLTNQALSLAPPFEFPEVAYELLWQMGRLRKAQGDIEAAVGYYSQAVNILSSLRADLVTIQSQVQFSFRESVEPIYRELVGLLLEGEGKVTDRAKLKLARQTIESLQLAELDNFFQDACADVKARIIDEVDRTAAVIYPIILSDRLEVIVSVPDRPLRHYNTAKSKAELESIFKRARVSLRRTAFEQERLPLAQQLYDLLIRPVEKDLAASDVKTLVFVLDGYLRNVPMAILHDGQKYLIEKYSIALTPGLQLLEPRPLTQVRLRALTGALTEARQGFPALPAVASEVEQISSAVPADTLINQQFITQELQAQINKIPFPVVHLATHGQFSSKASETFILTWDERINVKQLDRLLRSRSQEKKAPIELLVLSACETAAGDDRAALGLAGIAIRSGARSTLATLWQVNDESTSIVMAEFYRELTKPGISKAEALRNAQLKLLRNPQYQNPYFWAPFVLVGNWQ
ncbi:CHAT domain-containing protein [Aerosakkonema funiforme]|uniref:CHAT domain-containing protein n=1 Tax=Aerosakkonema funiforme TaxID=1246630 RepID=UPI0035B9FE47